MLLVSETVYNLRVESKMKKITKEKDFFKEKTFS